jgi:hypothetical protein
VLCHETIQSLSSGRSSPEQSYTVSADANHSKNTAGPATSEDVRASVCRASELLPQGSTACAYGVAAGTVVPEIIMGLQEVGRFEVRTVDQRCGGPSRSCMIFANCRSWVQFGPFNLCGLCLGNGKYATTPPPIVQGAPPSPHHMLCTPAVRVLALYAWAVEDWTWRPGPETELCVWS